MNVYPLYITMSTIPSRFERVKKNIIEISKNNPNAKIILNVPKRYIRFPEVREKDIANAFKNFKVPNVLINECDDHGPITKLTGSLHRVPQESILVLCDDDNYQKDAFKIIKKAQETDISSVHTFYSYVYRQGTSEPIVVPQGVDLISFYRPMLNHFKIDKNCFNVDDLMIAKFLKRKGILIKKIERPWKWPWIPDTSEVDSLFNNTNRDKDMKICYNS